ncbi:MAG: hypothetical protein ABSB41_02775 [Anaerolineales bacterium]|jgi:hypothetical protein
MIATLLITILIEGLVCAGYAFRYKKPLRPILVTCLFANLFTQPLLWLVLETLFVHYLAALLAAELAIVGIEAMLLYVVPNNRLRWQDALILSLAMNLASFFAGWFLPV